VAPNPKDYIILPEIISKEPLAPAVRHGDNQWKDIVNYSVLALINAEELGITSKNVDEMLKSKDPKISAFWASPPATARPWAWMRNSPTTSSSRSATTVKSLNEMWASTHRWASNAA
jgi:hypothetical protein